MARPTKLTPERQALFLSALAEGNYLAVAAQIAGIGSSTYYRWMVEGKEAKNGPYLEFWEAVKKSEADAEAARVKRIAKAGESGVWQADAWYLERRYPNRWGKQAEQRQPEEKISEQPIEMSEESACERHGVIRE